MDVFVDALSARAGGGQTYLRNLLACDPPPGMRIFVAAAPSLSLPRLGVRIERIDVAEAFAPPALRVAWECWQLPRLLERTRADVLLAPGGTLLTPVPSGCRTVAVFQNMLPFDRAQRRRYPPGYVRARLALLEQVLVRSLQAADLVICVSEHGRRELLRRLPRAPRRVEVVLHGVAPVFRRSGAPAPRPSWVPAGEYAIYVSTIDVYKAQVEVVRAWSILAARRPTPERLLLVGAEYAPYGARVRREIRRLGLEGRVVLTGPVPHPELPGAYRNAKAAIFASECENCPLVVLEALAAGRPLVSSRREPMPELAGDAAAYFDPASPGELADRLVEVLDDPARAEELGRRAAARSRAFDWEETAARTWSAVAAAAGRSAGAATAEPRRAAAAPLRAVPAQEAREVRVVIDALSARQGGGKTYLRNLLSFAAPDGLRVSIVASPALDLPRLGAGIERVDVPEVLERPPARVAWERLALPRLLRSLDAEVLFSPGGTLVAPVDPGCITVSMFRNMLPFDHVQRARYPIGYTRARLALLERVLLHSMLGADLLILISEHGRTVLEARAGRPLPRTVVIPHGISAAFRERAGAARPVWVPPGEYLLYVSTLDFYKAQVEVVRAFSLLRERRPTREKLVLAGPEYGPYGALVRDEIRKLGLEGDVVVTGEKPYESLPGAYRHAKLVVFASECEVCPNILLEAMAAGRPLVCSRRQPMPEFARDAVRYFDPAAPEELAREVAAVIDRPDVLEDLARRAEARSRDFDWARTTARTWEAILQAVRERRAARGGAEERRG